MLHISSFFFSFIRLDCVFDSVDCDDWGRSGNVVNSQAVEFEYRPVNGPQSGEFQTFPCDNWRVVTKRPCGAFQEIGLQPMRTIRYGRFVDG